MDMPNVKFHYALEPTRDVVDEETRLESVVPSLHSIDVGPKRNTHVHATIECPECRTGRIRIGWKLAIDVERHREVGVVCDNEDCAVSLTIEGRLGFSKEIIRKKWKEAAGRCPCETFQHEQAHPESGHRCARELKWEQRDMRPHDDYPGSWFPHRLASSAPWVEESCMVMCLSCHLLRTNQ